MFRSKAKAFAFVILLVCFALAGALCAAWPVDPPRAPAPAPAVTEPAPSATPSQARAVRAAVTYLAAGPLSRTALVAQLVSDGASPTDAAYAVDYVRADWSAQATRAAQRYVSRAPLYRDALIRQLVYTGYTSAEAAGAADAVGL